MTRCANAMGAGKQSFGAGSCAQRVMPEPMTASHLLSNFFGCRINLTEVRS